MQNTKVVKQEREHRECRALPPRLLLGDTLTRGPVAHIRHLAAPHSLRRPLRKGNARRMSSQRIRRMWVRRARSAILARQVADIRETRTTTSAVKASAGACEHGSRRALREGG